MGIIYKYYGFDAGLAAIKSESLGFNNPVNFNDPMEGRLWLHQKGCHPKGLDFFLQNVGILCLTNDAMNPLMWSHYGQSHTGFVIGYDSTDPVFGDQKDSIFDVASGKIFYSPEFDIDTEEVESCSRAALSWLVSGMDSKYLEENRQILRHIFLMKQKCWQYEKEVRVVKVLSNIFESQASWVDQTGNKFGSISTPFSPMVSIIGNEIKLLSLKNKSIKKVILGMKNILLESGVKIHSDKKIEDVISDSKVTVERAAWNSRGEMKSVAVEKNIHWGFPNVMSSHSLSLEQLVQIKKKLTEVSAPNQPLTVSKYMDGSFKAFWKNEL